jgi:hypothetical protein
MAADFPLDDPLLLGKLLCDRSATIIFSTHFLLNSEKYFQKSIFQLDFW